MLEGENRKIQELGMEENSRKKEVERLEPGIVFTNI